MNPPNPPTSEITDDTPMFTAGEVETRTGVPATTLRQWERRYGLPSPQRTASGYRLYSPNDVACVEFLKARIDEGVSVSRAAQLYALERSTAKPAPAASTTHPRAVSAADLARRTADAALTGDAGAADRVLAQAHASLPVEDVLIHVVQPALVDIGERWHRNEITVAHEHQASSYLRGKVHALLEMAGQPRHGPTVIVACGPGEWHEIGSLILAVFLRRAGLRTHYLGANTPVADLARFARDVNAAAILVSAGSAAVIEELQVAEPLLRGAAPLIAFGGAAFNDNPALAADLGGVYLGADAAAALDGVLARLTS